MIGIESGKLFACAAFVRTTVVTIIPSPLQRLHGFGYNGIVRIHLSTWLVFQLEGSVHSVPRDVTLPSLDREGGLFGMRFVRKPWKTLTHRREGQSSCHVQRFGSGPGTALPALSIVEALLLFGLPVPKNLQSRALRPATKSTLGAAIYSWVKEGAASPIWAFGLLGSILTL